MSKRAKRTTQPQPATDGTQRLVVVGVRRKEPDWDSYIDALLLYALRTVKDENASATEKGGDK
jgi:hypothetical protein